MALFFPRPLRESSFAVTRKECVAQDCRLNGPFSISGSYQSTWNNRQDTVRWREGLATVHLHWTSLVQLGFVDTWKQNILCGKPQFSSGVFLILFVLTTSPSETKRIPQGDCKYVLAQLCTSATCSNLHSMLSLSIATLKLNYKLLAHCHYEIPYEGRGSYREKLLKKKERNVDKKSNLF